MDFKVVWKSHRTATEQERQISFPELPPPPPFAGAAPHKPTFIIIIGSCERLTCSAVSTQSLRPVMGLTNYKVKPYIHSTVRCNTVD